jgi:hypothetical protein
MNHGHAAAVTELQLKATGGLHPLTARLKANSTALQLCYAASSELSSLVWAALFVLQRCTILLCP